MVVFFFFDKRVVVLLWRKRRKKKRSRLIYLLSITKNFGDQGEDQKLVTFAHVRQIPLTRSILSFRFFTHLPLHF